MESALSDEIVAAQWRTQLANREAKPAREASMQSASHRGSGGPPPGKLDLLRSFLVQSWDETARFNNLLARLSILLVRRPPHLPHLLLRPGKHAEKN